MTGTAADDHGIPSRSKPPAAVSVAIYTRVSTWSKTDNRYVQDPAVQERPLAELARQRGWRAYRVYSDRASGARANRPALKELMEDARRGKFSAVLVWRFDRFARSVKHLVDALEEFRALGVEFISHQEAVDTGTPMGKAMFSVIAAMAELERDLIRERVQAGLDHARRHGTRSGRAIGRPRLIYDRGRVRELRSAGQSMRSISRRLGISLAAVQRACADGRIKTPTENAA